MPTPRLLARLLTATALLATAVAVVLVSPLPRSQQATASAPATNCTETAPVLNGTVYEISTPGQLLSLARSTNSTSLSAAYRQTIDLDLTNCGYWPGIGGGNVNPFTGTYDGGGYGISNLVSTSATVDTWGLFRNTDNATIADVTLDGVTISGTATQVGSLVGYAEGTTISAVTVTNASVSALNNVGGLVGRTAGSTRTTIEATVTGSVHGSRQIGGLLGWASGPTTIRNATTTATVSATVETAGGIVGILGDDLELHQVTFSGDVTAAGDNVGGIIGYAEETMTMNGVTRNGSVQGADYVGGIIGFADGHVTLSVNNNSDSVSGRDKVGGAIGYLEAGQSLTVSNSNFGGSVTGRHDVGGVLGWSGSSASTHVIISQSTITAPVIAQGDEAGGIVGRANGHVTISAVTRSGDVSVSATGYGAGGFVGYNNTWSLLIEDSTSSSDVRGRSEVGGAIGVFTNETATLNNVVLSGTVYGNSVSNVTQVGCYVGTVDDANDAGLSKPGSRATGSKVVDGVTTRCPDYVAPGMSGGSLPPAVSELVTQPIAPPTTTPSTTVPTTMPPPATTVAPTRDEPLPLLIDGELPELAAGDVMVVEDGEPVTVSVFVENDTELVLEAESFELRLAGDCTVGACNIDTAPEGQAVLILEEDGSATTAGVGFQPGSRVDVWLFSEPRYLGALTVNADGTFRGNVELSGIDAGEHTLQVNGTNQTGDERSANLGVIVNPASSPAPTPGPGVLPATGTTTTPLWLTALVLLGIGLIITTTRRRTTR